MSFERFRPAKMPVATDTDSWFGGRMMFNDSIALSDGERVLVDASLR